MRHTSSPLRSSVAATPPRSTATTNRLCPVCTTHNRPPPRMGGTFTRTDGLKVPFMRRGIEREFPSFDSARLALYRGGGRTGRQGPAMQATTRRSGDRRGVSSPKVYAGPVGHHEEELGGNSAAEVVRHAFHARRYSRKLTVGSHRSDSGSHRSV